MSLKEQTIIDEYLSASSKSRVLHERARKVIPSGTTRAVTYYKPYPLYSQRARGSRIWDVDGVERIDYCFNYGSLILGHSNPKVIEAISSEVERGLGRGQPTEHEVELAEKICKLVPCAERVKFTASGTEAVMNAIRAARAYTKKDKVIAFEGAYHGSSDLASKDGLSFNAEGVPYETELNTIVVPFNDPDALQKSLVENKGRVAAALLEPFLYAGGTIVPDDGYAKAVRELATAMDVLLIFDEVITGFRLAKGGWQEKFNVVPDLVALGKNVTGGMPGGAVAGSAEIMEDVFGYPPTDTLDILQPKVELAGTYNAFPLSMIAGIATLDQLNSDLYKRIDGFAEDLKRGFITIAEEMRFKVRAPGVGSVFQFYFTDHDLTSTRYASLADHRTRRHFDLGLLNEGIYFPPGRSCVTSAATTADDVKETLQIIRNVMKEMRS